MNDAPVTVTVCRCLAQKGLLAFSIDPPARMNAVHASPSGGVIDADSAENNVSLGTLENNLITVSGCMIAVHGFGQSMPQSYYPAEWKVVRVQVRCVGKTNIGTTMK